MAPPSSASPPSPPHTRARVTLQKHPRAIKVSLLSGQKHFWLKWLGKANLQQSREPGHLFFFILSQSSSDQPVIDGIALEWLVMRSTNMSLTKLVLWQAMFPAMEFSGVKVSPGEQCSVTKESTNRGWRCPRRVFPLVKVSWMCYVRNIEYIYVFLCNPNVWNNNKFTSYSSFSCSSLLAIPVFLGNTGSFIPVLISNINSLITYCSSHSEFLSICTCICMYLGYRMAVKD